VDTVEIIATTAAGFSTLLARWAAYTSDAARIWQRDRDQRKETRVRVEVHTAELGADAHLCTLFVSVGQGPRRTAATAAGARLRFSRPVRGRSHVASDTAPTLA
jgi:hypothetical protein